MRDKQNAAHTSGKGEPLSIRCLMVRNAWQGGQCIWLIPFYGFHKLILSSATLMLINFMKWGQLNPFTLKSKEPKF